MFNLEQFMSNEDMAVLGGVVMVYGIILLLVSVVGIVSYIFQSIGLFKMAKNLGINHAWMAWVPILNTFTFGRIGAKYVKKDGKPSAKFGGWLLGLDLATIALCVAMIASVVVMIIQAVKMGNSDPTVAFFTSFLSFIGIYLVFMGCAIAFSVVYYIALWRIYSIFDSSNATVFLIVSILFGITTPFFIFALRNNKPALTYAERIGFVPPVEPQMVTLPVMEETPITTKTEDE